MTNILLESYYIDAEWLRDALAKYLKPQSRVLVVAFSFRDKEVKGVDDWQSRYGRENGKYYHAVVDPFQAYGIPEENITFLNYFTDSPTSAAEKVKRADIIYFLGGLPDRMMDRIVEFGLYDELLRHEGVVMGVSAGALIQLSEYHLSPDKDYPEFGYYRGIPYCGDFYLEVHYEGNPVQDDAIRRVVRERAKPVYATHDGQGAIICDNGSIYTVGIVDVLERRDDIESMSAETVRG